MNAPLTADAIKEIKGSGFWSGATERRFAKLAQKLLETGVSDALVAETVREAWSIAQTEYGE